MSWWWLDNHKICTWFPPFQTTREDWRWHKHGMWIQVWVGGWRRCNMKALSVFMLCLHLRDNQSQCNMGMGAKLPRCQIELSVIGYHQKLTELDRNPAWICRAPTESWLMAAAGLVEGGDEWICTSSCWTRPSLYPYIKHTVTPGTKPLPKGLCTFWLLTDIATIVIIDLIVNTVSIVQQLGPSCHSCTSQKQWPLRLHHPLGSNSDPMGSSWKLSSAWSTT